MRDRRLIGLRRTLLLAGVLTPFAAVNEVDVDGSGDVHYRAEPRITKSIRGSGSVTALR